MLNKLLGFELLLEHKIANPSIERRMSDQYLYNKSQLGSFSTIRTAGKYYHDDLNVFHLDKLPTELDFMLRLTVNSKGNGVVAGLEIPQDTIILPYIGEVVLREDWNKTSRYVMDLDIPKYTSDEGVEHDLLRCKIDSNKHGNLSRYINHGCGQTANAKVAYAWHENKFYPIIVSVKEIPAGDEILYHYGYEYPVGSKLEFCKCGAFGEIEHRFGQFEEGGEKLYTCKFENCGKSFTKKQYKYNHEKAAHQILKCEYVECASKPAFTSYSGWQQHRRKHRESVILNGQGPSQVLKAKKIARKKKQAAAAKPS